MSIAIAKDIEMAAIIERLQYYEHTYGEKIAAWAIVAIVIYLVIAQ
jgi:hypothetical protein